jgi:hypothetical protein
MQALRSFHNIQVMKRTSESKPFRCWRGTRLAVRPPLDQLGVSCGNVGKKAASPQQIVPDLSCEDASQDNVIGRLWFLCTQRAGWIRVHATSPHTICSPNAAMHRNLDVNFAFGRCPGHPNGLTAREHLEPIKENPVNAEVDEYSANEVHFH